MSILPFGLDSLIGSLFKGSGGAASTLAGGLTAQRIPGQTQAGEYRPDGNSVGATYNYIPTGAGQIDPAILQLLMGGAGRTSGVMSMDPSQVGGVDLASLQALGMILQNPGTAQMLGAIPGVSGAYNAAGNAFGQAAGAYGDAATGYGTASRNLQGTADATAGQWGNLNRQMQANPYLAGAQADAGMIGQRMGAAGESITSQGSELSGLFADTVRSRLNNPFSAQALSGAQTAGGLMQSAGSGAYGQGTDVAGTAGAALPASASILNTAFDPQQALYDRTLQQTQDQLGVMLARSGLTGSGASAPIIADALSNFNIDWQNNQLGRQTQGLSAFNSGVGGAAQNIGAGRGLQTTGAGALYTGAQLPQQTFGGQTNEMLSQLSGYGGGLKDAAGLSTSGLGLQAAGNTYASDTYSSLLDPQLQMLQSWNAALPNLQNLYQGAATGLNNAAGAMGNVGAAYGSGANALGQAGSTGYGAYNMMGNDQFGGINSYMNAGAAGGSMNNQNISQMMDYINAIMTGSRNAADATKSVAGTTQNQNAGAAAALTPLIQGGFDWLGSQFAPGNTTIGPWSNSMANSTLRQYGYA